jgi:iron complex outermembrane receptor protein
LDAERATAAELGVDIARGPAFAQVTGFTTTVKDAIGGIFVSDDPFTQKNANIGALRSTGVEAAVALEISPHLRLDANYTFTNAKVTENDDDPTLVGNRGEGVAKHAIAGSATYRAGRFGATLRARYYSDQFEDITNESHLPPYAVTDVLGSWALTARSRVLLAVDNLLDRKYLASDFGDVGLRGAPRLLSVGLRLSTR